MGEGGEYVGKKRIEGTYCRRRAPGSPCPGAAFPSSSSSSDLGAPTWSPFKRVMVVVLSSRGRFWRPAFDYRQGQ